MTLPHEVSAMATASLPRVECAWCGATICAGAAHAQISHGACAECSARLLAEFRQGEQGHTR